MSRPRITGSKIALFAHALLLMHPISASVLCCARQILLPSVGTGRVITTRVRRARWKHPCVSSPKVWRGAKGDSSIRGVDNPELPARTLSGAGGWKGSRGTIAPKILLVDDDHCSVQAP